MKKITSLSNVVLLILLLVVFTIGCQQDTPKQESSSKSDQSSAQTQVTHTASLEPPSAPVNLEATAVSPNAVTIRWLDNSNDEDGFRVYRGITVVGTLAPNSNIFQDTGLQPGTTYQYAVRAYNQAGESQIALCTVKTPAPPSAPSNITANAITQSGVQLNWADNSDNEDGFLVYRDGDFIANVNAGINYYQDSGLQPATEYQYTIIAYNQYGESQPCDTIVKTLNPSITIRLDGIGVYDNREPFLRGKGDVYVLVGIVDGNNSIELKFPAGQDQTYSLDKNETISIGTEIYSTNAVADDLQIMFIGYESDDGAFEQLAYEALGMAIDMYTEGVATGLASAFNTSLGSIIGSLLGEEHDLLGQYELLCNKSNYWGVGQYTDIVLQDERGVDCLRLWFTIESQE